MSLCPVHLDENLVGLLEGISDISWRPWSKHPYYTKNHGVQNKVKRLFRGCNKATLYKYDFDCVCTSNVLNTVLPKCGLVDFQSAIVRLQFSRDVLLM